MYMAVLHKTTLPENLLIRSLSGCHDYYLHIKPSENSKTSPAGNWVFSADLT